jgi:hypothetical protein
LDFRDGLCESTQTVYNKALFSAVRGFDVSLLLNATKYHADTFVLSNQCELGRNFIVTLSLIRRTACARAQLSGCSSTNNAYSEMGQMAVCCHNLTLGAIYSRSALSLLVGALFKKFSLF